MQSPARLSIALLLAGSALTLAACGSGADGNDSATAEPAACPANDSGITLPPGFCATVFADNVGHARLMTVADDGTLYLNSWSGPYYSNDQPRDGGFLAALRDTDGDGRADVNERFGPGVAEGSGGGTGILLHGDWLYADLDDRIVRWRRASGSPGTLVPTGEPEVIVSGLPDTGEHPQHQFVIDRDGNLFVNVGAATNVCEVRMGAREPKVHNPCTETRTRAGLWRFKADQPGQTFSEAARYATGIRNIGGIRLDDAGQVIVSQHGRDLLGQYWPHLYTPEQGSELPAETLFRVKEGGDYGWPTCYYDGFQKKLVLAPEYGGDGGKAVGECAAKEQPIAVFPAHWAPTDILFYRGSQFPAAYREGVFVAFHGSWNRAPFPQAGFKVVFQPMANGAASGDHIVFADGFAGAERPGPDAYRPLGLATGPDGALYVSDDNRGRIWRITYQGPADAKVAAAPKPVYKPAPAESGGADLPVPPGATAEQVALGGRIFNGEEKGGTCSGCHGLNGGGGAMGSNLTTGEWLWGDGSLAAIEAIIRKGVDTPKRGSGAMPPLGGVDLDDADVKAVTAYVWALGHQPK